MRRDVLRRITSILALVAVAIAIGLAVREQIVYSKNLGNQLSFRGDGASELSSLNAAMHYYKDGFLKYAALPNFASPPNKWYTDPADEVTGKQIYTHYPAGANWVLGVALHVCGPNNFPCYRYFPILFGGLCLFLMYTFLALSLGALCAAAITVTLLQIPMTTAMMHDLGVPGYSLSLFLLQLGFGFYVFKSVATPSWRHLVTFFLMSYVQGWIGFDYFVISGFFPVVLYLATLPAKSLRFCVTATICSTAGFLAAFFSHVVQNCIYFWLEGCTVIQAINAALRDFFLAAHTRSTGFGHPPRDLDSSWYVVNLYTGKYFIDHAGQVGLYCIVAATGAALLMFIGRSIRRQSRNRIVSNLHQLWALCAAFVISVGWISIMRDHALDGTHQQWLPRHFILIVFTGILLLGNAIRDTLTSVWSKISRP